MEYPKFKKFLKQKLQDWNPNVTLIEDKSNGTALIQDLKNETQYAITPVNPVEKKTDRAERNAPIIDTGKVSLPRDSKHLNDFKLECMYFPNGRNDDMVDAMTQYLDWARSKQQTAKVRISLL